MERQAERIMGDIVALAAVEEVLLQIVADSEERAAGCVDSTVYTIWAQRTLGGCGS